MEAQQQHHPQQKQQQHQQQHQQQQMEFKVGDPVAWNYGAGKARGHVVEKLTEDRKLGARTFKATPEEPKYLLKIDKSGKEAIRKGETLERIDDDSAAPAAAPPPPPKDESKKVKKSSKKKEEDEEDKGEEEEEEGDKSD